LLVRFGKWFHAQLPTQKMHLNLCKNNSNNPPKKHPKNKKNTLAQWNHSTNKMSLWSIKLHLSNTVGIELLLQMKNHLLGVYNCFLWQRSTSQRSCIFVILSNNWHTDDIIPQLWEMEWCMYLEELVQIEKLLMTCIVLNLVCFLFLLFIFDGLLFWSKAENKWSLITPTGTVIPKPRFGHTAVAVGNRMWVFGGAESKYDCFNDLFYFDFGTSFFFSMFSYSFDWSFLFENKKQTQRNGLKWKRARMTLGRPKDIITVLLLLKKLLWSYLEVKSIWKTITMTRCPFISVHIYRLLCVSPLLNWIYFLVWICEYVQRQKNGNFWRAKVIKHQVEEQDKLCLLILMLPNCIFTEAIKEMEDLTVYLILSHLTLVITLSHHDIDNKKMCRKTRMARRKYWRIFAAESKMYSLGLWLQEWCCLCLWRIWWSLCYWKSHCFRFQRWTSKYQSLINTFCLV